LLDHIFRKTKIIKILNTNINSTVYISLMFDVYYVLCVIWMVTIVNTIVRTD